MLKKLSLRREALT